MNSHGTLASVGQTFKIVSWRFEENPYSIIDEFDEWFRRVRAIVEMEIGTRAYRETVDRVRKAVKMELNII